MKKTNKNKILDIYEETKHYKLQREFPFYSKSSIFILFLTYTIFMLFSIFENWHILFITTIIAFLVIVIYLSNKNSKYINSKVFEKTKNETLYSLYSDKIFLTSEFAQTSYFEYLLKEALSNNEIAKKDIYKFYNSLTFKTRKNKLITENSMFNTIITIFISMFFAYFSFLSTKTEPIAQIFELSIYITLFVIPILVLIYSLTSMIQFKHLELLKLKDNLQYFINLNLKTSDL